MGSPYSKPSGRRRRRSDPGMPMGYPGCGPTCGFHDHRGSRHERTTQSAHINPRMMDPRMDPRMAAQMARMDPRRAQRDPRIVAQMAQMDPRRAQTDPRMAARMAQM